MAEISADAPALTTEAPAIATQSGRAITNKLDRDKVDLAFDILVLPTVAVVLIAAFHIHFMLTGGDWDFWTDWKDRRWWPLITPVTLITFPAAIQYILWKNLRIPWGATVCVVLIAIGMWISRSTQFVGWAYYPMSFVWPATFIAMGLVLDCTLVITRSFFLTGIFGGFAWACIFYPANWPLLAPFHQPIEWHGVLMSLADLQGYMYVRTGTPEYIRIIEEGTLRTFGEHVAPITVFFAAFVCILMYFLWNRIGALLSKTFWVKRL